MHLPPALLPLQATIFLLIGAGYLLTRLGVLPPSARKPLTDLIIDFILPCNIIVSFLLRYDTRILAGCAVILAVSVLLQAACFALGRLLYGRAQPDRAPVLQYATMVSNAGFLGSPIAEGLYGAQGLLYASVYLVPMRVMMWSVGLSCFADVKGRDVIKKTLTHPCIVAVGIGLVLMVTQCALPAGVEQALRAASGCNTALSMLVIGNILAEVDPRQVFTPQVLRYCFVRLLLIPLAVLAGCRLAGLDRLVTAVAAVLAGMPAPATTAILAARYGKAERLAVALVFVSTLLSLATLPLLAVLADL